MLRRKMCGIALVGLALILSGCTRSDPELTLDAPASTTITGPGGIAPSANWESGGNFVAVLSSEQAGVETKAKGRASFQINKAGTAMGYKVVVTNIENATKADLCRPSSGAVIATLCSEAPAPGGSGSFSGVLAEGSIADADLIGGGIGTIEELRELMSRGQAYVTVRTEQHPGGAVKGPVVPPRSDWVPEIAVHNPWWGTVTSRGIPEGSMGTMEVPGGITLTFSIIACPFREAGIDNPCGDGKIAGYRFYWSDDRKKTPWKPFIGEDAAIGVPVPPGVPWNSRDLVIEVKGTYATVSQVRLTVNIVPMTMQRPLLIVDDWEEYSDGFILTNGGLPSDVENDAFWEEMVGDVEGFDPAVDVIEPGGAMSLAVLAGYQTVIWNATAAYNGTTNSLINEVIAFKDPYSLAMSNPNVIAFYMAAGGHVLLVGQHVMCGSVNRDLFAGSPVYPMIFRYELGGDQVGRYRDSRVGEWGVGEGSFAYDECCLNVLDIAFIRDHTAVRRMSDNNCPVSNVRTQSARDNGVRTAISLPGTYVFPEMSLRPEVASPGKWYSEERSGLNSDIYNPTYFASIPMGGDFQGPCNDVAELNPPRECFEPIFGNGCLNSSSMIYGAPVAFWTSKFGNRVPDVGGVAARSAVWGFQPVYFNPSEVKRAIDIILFDEWKLTRKVPASSPNH